jgi:outer membrane protein insertion porin family
MRQEAGESIKSAISHSYTLDTRDDKISATRGGYLKLFHEFAGIGGDASFYKTEAEGQVSRPIVSGLVSGGLSYSPLYRTDVILQSFSLAGRAGFIKQLNKAPAFSDRFQLGGPTSVRSFKQNGLGPRDGGEYIHCTSSSYTDTHCSRLNWW